VPCSATARSVIRRRVSASSAARRFIRYRRFLPVIPLHRHNREDEYSWVIEGRLGALLGDEVVIGEPGDLIFKPRGQWHTLWNAGDTPARIRELISPAGFVAGLCARYALDLQPETVPGLLERFGLVIGERL
jgi:mannose-6-phosphate isomerase-like protein (cupin superfamily)